MERVPGAVLTRRDTDDEDDESQEGEEQRDLLEPRRDRLGDQRGDFLTRREVEIVMGSSLASRAAAHPQRSWGGTESRDWVLSVLGPGTLSPVTPGRASGPRSNGIPVTRPCSART